MTANWDITAEPRRKSDWDYLPAYSGRDSNWGMLSRNDDYTVACTRPHDNWGTLRNSAHTNEVIRTVLPEVAKQSERGARRPSAVAADFVMDSTHTEQNGGLKGLTKGDLKKEFLNILEMIQAGDDARDIFNHTTQRLSRMFDKDQRNGNLERLGCNTLRTFRALSTISYVSKSPVIGKAMHRFFDRYHPEILDIAGDKAVAGWALALYHSRMSNGKKEELLETCFAERRELVDVLQDLRDVPGAWKLAQHGESYLGRGCGNRLRNAYGNDWERHGRDYGREVSRRSLSNSPERRYDDRLYPRSRSLPGRQRIVKQADKVISLSEVISHEAERLKDLALRR